MIDRKGEGRKNCEKASSFAKMSLQLQGLTLAKKVCSLFAPFYNKQQKMEGSDCR
jgi:hypothetical protein